MAPPAPAGDDPGPSGAVALPTAIGRPCGGTGRRIPLAVKVVYTAFMAVLIPVYWVHYGPTNFLYFCDAALLVTLVALWTESSYLASAQAVAITLPQALWIVDFCAYALFRRHVVDLTGYMFDAGRPLYLRALSFFHFWLPFLLLWTVARLGFHRRAWIGQSLFGIALLLASYASEPPPIDPRVGNLNLIHGVSATTPQTWIDPRLWLLGLMAVTVVVINLPTHLLLSRWDARRRARPR